MSWIASLQVRKSPACPRTRHAGGRRRHMTVAEDAEAGADGRARIAGGSQCAGAKPRPARSSDARLIEEVCRTVQTGAGRPRALATSSPLGERPALCATGR